MPFRKRLHLLMGSFVAYQIHYDTEVIPAGVPDNLEPDP